MQVLSSRRSPAPARRDAENNLSFDTLRYAVVWEDIDLLERGLQVHPGDDVLSITSAGDNVLGLLLQEPASVTAVDLNPAQNALLELKLAALQTLSYEAFVTLLGYRSGARRLSYYEQCRPRLPAYARSYWDRQASAIERGIIRSGRLENYLAMLREEVILPAAPEEVVRAWVRMSDRNKQQAVFDRYFKNEAFRDRFTAYTSREVMAKHGRDPAQFAYVDGDVGNHFYAQFADACTRLPLRGNFYLEQFLTGQLRNLDQAHPYLWRANFERLRHLADRVSVVTASLQSFLARCREGAFSKGNFSDLFEYMARDEAARLMTEMRRVFREGGRLAYWSLLVDRSLPRALRALYRPLSEQARMLGRRDRAWFYRSFHLCEVV